MSTVISDHEFKKLLSETTTSLPFNYEISLIDVVIKNKDRFLDGDDVYASTEIPIGAGKVDIVAGNIENVPPKNHESKILVGYDAYILSKLYYRQKLRIETIVRRTELPQHEVEEALKRLNKLGYIYQRNNCYLRSEPFVTNLISIEGKIKNWRRALQQAYRNKLFSTQSYVALDARHSRPALNRLDQFQEAHVGLVIVFSNGEMVFAYTPPKEKPITNVMPIVAETSLIDRFVNGQDE